MLCQKLVVKGVEKGWIKTTFSNILEKVGISEI